MDAQTILKNYQRVKAKKDDNNWRFGKLNDYFMPLDSGTIRFDNVGEESADMAASHLLGIIANPARKWFTAEHTDEGQANSSTVAQFYEEVTNITLQKLALPEVDFYSKLVDCVRATLVYDKALFTCVKGTIAPLRFGVQSYRDFCFEHDADGQLTHIYREIADYTIGGLALEFGVDKLSDTSKAKHMAGKTEEKVKVLHCIYPRIERNPTKNDTKNSRFVGVYVEMDAKHSIAEEAYSLFPAALMRWSGGDAINCPASKSLVDIAIANEMRSLKLEGARVAAQPPMIGPGNAFASGVINYTGGSYNVLRDGINPALVREMPGLGDVRLTLEEINDARQNVRRNFYIDMLQMMIQKQMTATEAMEVADERFRILAGSIMRLTNALAEIVTVAMNHLAARGAFPAPPPELTKAGGLPLKIRFISPIQRAQRQSERNGIINFVSTMGQIAQFKPEVLDHINGDEVVKVLHDIEGITQKILMSDKDVQAMREQRAQAQQAQNMAAMAQQGGDAAQSVAAGAKGLSEAGL